ncbi:hypothetical protein B0T22DRAFT_533035 [Podospora appendiculata]|uniref:Stc1 domain-containing protein n=1 Tax=Podospora appendiculata TaxID=314037 RepID=A0AAE0XI95_9PEZI|nr:hypothetical protein B0T22DRAFT_533035 [Podospora appendiculata]
MAPTRATRGLDINSANARAQRRTPNIHPFDIAARLADKAREGIAKKFRSNGSTDPVRTPVRPWDDLELYDLESDEEMDDETPPPRYSFSGTTKPGSGDRAVRCLKELDGSIDWRHDCAVKVNYDSEIDQTPIQCLKSEAKHQKKESSLTAPALDSSKMRAAYAGRSAAYEIPSMEGQPWASPAFLPHTQHFGLPFMAPPPGLPTVMALPAMPAMPTMPVYNIPHPRMMPAFVPGPVPGPGHVNIRRPVSVPVPVPVPVPVSVPVTVSAPLTDPFVSEPVVNSAPAVMPERARSRSSSRSRSRSRSRSPVHVHNRVSQYHLVKRARERSRDGDTSAPLYQHTCYLCGDRRSKAYSDNHKIVPGRMPQHSLCTSCRARPDVQFYLAAGLGPDGYNVENAGRHWCPECGILRSLRYHNKYPKGAKASESDVCHRCEEFADYVGSPKRWTSTSPDSSRESWESWEMDSDSHMDPETTPTTLRSTHRSETSTADSSAIYSIGIITPPRSPVLDASFRPEPAEGGFITPVGSQSRIRSCLSNRTPSSGTSDSRKGGKVEWSDPLVSSEQIAEDYDRSPIETPPRDYGVRIADLLSDEFNRSRLAESNRQNGALKGPSYERHQSEVARRVSDYMSEPKPEDQRNSSDGAEVPYWQTEACREELASNPFLSSSSSEAEASHLEAASTNCSGSNDNSMSDNTDTYTATKPEFPSEGLLYMDEAEVARRTERLRELASTSSSTTHPVSLSPPATPVAGHRGHHRSNHVHHPSSSPAPEFKMPNFSYPTSRVYYTGSPFSVISVTSSAAAAAAGGASHRVAEPEYLESDSGYTGTLLTTERASSGKAHGTKYKVNDDKKKYSSLSGIPVPAHQTVYDMSEESTATRPLSGIPAPASCMPLSGIPMPSHQDPCYTSAMEESPFSTVFDIPASTPLSDVPLSGIPIPPPKTGSSGSGSGSDSGSSRRVFETVARWLASSGDDDGVATNVAASHYAPRAPRAFADEADSTSAGRWASDPMASCVAHTGHSELGNA